MTETLVEPDLAQTSMATPVDLVSSWPISHAAKIMGMEDDREMVLCAPASYLDCTRPGPIPDRVIRDQSAVVVVRPTGELVGMDLSGAEVYRRTIEGVETGSIRRALNLRVSCVDVNGKKINTSFFGAVTHDSQLDWVHAQPDPNAPFQTLHGYFALYGRGPIKDLVLRRVQIVPPQWIGKVWPQYRGIPGRVAGARIVATLTGLNSSQDAWKSCIQYAVNKITQDLETPAEEVLDLIGERKSPRARLEHLLEALHHPSSVDQGERALRAARKIAVLSLRRSAMTQNLRPYHPKAAIPITEEQVTKALGCVKDRTLTKDQRAAIQALVDGFRQGTPASILLNADVATGKTLVFLVASAAAQLAGAKVAILAPTALLAEQTQAEYAKTFAAPLGLGCELIAAEGKIKDKSALLVGTLGLNSVCRKQRFQPNVLIVDEQHKFSVAQRQILLGEHTHAVEVTATPIPRSLASVALGGMTIVGMQESPVKKSIASRVINPKTERAEISRAVHECIASGGRAAFIYPLVRPLKKKSALPGDDADQPTRHELSPEEERASVERAYQAINGMLPGRVGMLHGQLSDDKKKEALNAFRTGQTPVMVASTILETGIDVPDVRVMAVLDADYYGAAQLHQLRGRLARNGGRAQFFMVPSPPPAKPPETLKPGTQATIAGTEDPDEVERTTALIRLENVARNASGGDLAKEDMELRGMGALDGEMQSGKTPMTFHLLRLTPGQVMSLWEELSPEGDAPTDTAPSYSAGQPRTASADLTMA